MGFREDPQHNPYEQIYQSDMKYFQEYLNSTAKYEFNGINLNWPYYFTKNQPSSNWFSTIFLSTSHPFACWFTAVSQMPDFLSILALIFQTLNESFIKPLISHFYYFKSILISLFRPLIYNIETLIINKFVGQLFLFFCSRLLHTIHSFCQKPLLLPLKRSFAYSFPIYFLFFLLPFRKIVLNKLFKIPELNNFLHNIFYSIISSFFCRENHFLTLIHSYLDFILKIIDS